MANTDDQKIEATQSYVELMTEGYTALVDAYATANRRSLEYVKSLYEIFSRPYTSTAIETSVRENFDRANQAVTLTVNELQAVGQHNNELLEKLARNSAKWQESAALASRGLVKTYLSNVNFVRDQAGAQVDSFTKRVEEMQAAVSRN